jgi:hypothetical protein
VSEEFMNMMFDTAVHKGIVPLSLGVLQ